MDPGSQSLANAEFVAVDVETNGRGDEGCELTEVGAVLVGGGELHDAFESVVRVDLPLSRGIQRFTGITQAMVDAAPPAAEVLPRLAEMLEGRVLVAHNASFDRRVLRHAFERCGLEWPDPPALCTVALARRFAPLAGQRKLVPLARSLGIEPEGAHRALVDARTCAQVFCALFPKLCASAATVAAALALLAPRRPARPRREGRRVPREERPDLRSLPEDPGVYVFRDERGRPLYVGKSVSVRSRARAHFCAPSGWTERAEVVDYRPTNSELGALVLENRLIKAWRPAGNVKLKRTDRFVYIRCRLDPPYPMLEVGPEPAAGNAVNVGPLRGRRAALELAGQLNSLFQLRHCGRSLPRRLHPSIYGQMGRCLSPCLGDLDPNAYRGRVDEALAVFDRPGEAPARLAGQLERQMREAAGARHFERAAVLRNRLERIAGVVGRLDGLLEAVHARSRLVVAEHPARGRFDAFWIVAGRVVDWGPLPEGDELRERTAAAIAAPPPRQLRPEDVDEVRIVASWLAAHEPPSLGLEEAAAGADLEAWVGGAADRAGAPLALAT